jgi:hypothetical protein
MEGSARGSISLILQPPGRWRARLKLKQALWPYTRRRPAGWRGAAGAAGKDGSAPAIPDRIEVIAHFPPSDGPVTQLAAGTHWQKNYLYVDHGAAGAVAIVDVTNPAAPADAGELYVPKQETGESLDAVVGTAALMTSPAPTATHQTTKRRPS